MSRPRLVRILGRQYLLPTWYPAPLVTGLALVDQVRRVMSPAAQTRAMPPLDTATIVVAKPDHFGDLVQSTALLRALRDQLPNARIVLVHGSWAREVGQWLVAHGYVHDLVTYDAAWLQAPGTPWMTRLRTERSSRSAASARLRDLHPDVYLDIRCTSPNTIDLGIDSGATLRMGFGLRGRSWQYHSLITYRPETSLGQNWLHALDALGLRPARYSGPVLPPTAPLHAKAPIIVQPGSRTTAKEASLAVWEALLPAIAERAPVMLVGSAADRERFASLRKLVPSSQLHDAMGATSFGELVDATGRARAAIGVESMVAHLAVGHRRPTVVLNNPKASGIVAFPDDLPSLTFVDITADPRRIAAQTVAHLDRSLG
jgi:ADP-heptose:LPS heptosyltransferase